MNKDKKAVIDRLQSYSDRMNQIMKLIGDKQRLTAEEKTKAQQLMKTLKEDMKEDSRYGQISRNEEKMNEWEKRYYYPAIQESICRIRAKWNSDPIKSRWHSELYSAQIDLSHMLSQLRE